MEKRLEGNWPTCNSDVSISKSLMVSLQIYFNNLNKDSLLDSMEKRVDQQRDWKMQGADLENFQGWSCEKSHYVADIILSHLQLTFIHDIFTKDSNPGRKKIFFGACESHPLSHGYGQGTVTRTTGRGEMGTPKEKRHCIGRINRCPL